MKELELSFRGPANSNLRLSCGWRRCPRAGWWQQGSNPGRLPKNEQFVRGEEPRSARAGEQVSSLPLPSRGCTRLASSADPNVNFSPHRIFALLQKINNFFFIPCNKFKK